MKTILGGVSSNTCTSLTEEDERQINFFIGGNHAAAHAAAAAAAAANHQAVTEESSIDAAVAATAAVDMETTMNRKEIKERIRMIQTEASNTRREIPID